MENITITLPHYTAVELMLLADASKDTGNKEFDEHMKIIVKKLRDKI